MSTSLEGYAALVTGGGSGGLGYSHARLLAERGAMVAVTDIVDDHLKKTEATFAKAGLKVLAIKADNRKVADIKRAVRTVEKRFGKIDILVNNAGISGMHAHVDEVTEKMFDDLFDTHVKGAFFMTSAVVPGMKERRYGRIINTGSAFAMAGSLAMSHYTGAKGALHALTRAWARELGPYGITVNTIASGLVSTPMTRMDLTPKQFKGLVATFPRGRSLEAIEISYGVAWLASREADMVTGQVLAPNAGQAIVGI